MRHFSSLQSMRTSRSSRLAPTSTLVDSQRRFCRHRFLYRAFSSSSSSSKLSPNSNSSNNDHDNQIDHVTFRIVSINDVYDLSNLPKLQTFLSELTVADDIELDGTTLTNKNRQPADAVLLCGDFLSPSTLSSIDGGRGMVSTLRTVGVTHVSFGNHEQDLKLPTLHQRIIELSKSIEVVNSNVLPTLPIITTSPVEVSTDNNNDNVDNHNNSNEWIRSLTHQYSLLRSNCGRVTIALIGLLSDEPGLFRDNTFKSIPIHNVLETYTTLHNHLTTSSSSQQTHQNGTKTKTKMADFVLPMTHASMPRDKELAHHMLNVALGDTDKNKATSDGNDDDVGHIGYIILGGHEHEPYNEIVRRTDDQNDDDDTHRKEHHGDDSKYVQILKSGMDAQSARVLDLTFEVPPPTAALLSENETSTLGGEEESSSLNSTIHRTPRLVQIESELVDLTKYDSSPIAQQVVDKHMSVIVALENEIIVDVDESVTTLSSLRLPPGTELSSQRTRFEQTTVGSIFCQMMKEELEVDVAMINGAVLKGDMTYPSGKMTYAQLKAELPFPTKMVIIPMKEYELQEAIHYSRTSREDGTDPDLDDVPRRGFLQVDDDYNKNEFLSSMRSDRTLKVALPRNLLGGFCKIRPLMELGSRLKNDGLFPGEDDYVPAIDLIVRHACKNRWSRLVEESGTAAHDFFKRWDLNGDGVLEFDEIQKMLTDVLGHCPPDFMVQDMIDSIDEDHNGVIDESEISHLIAQMERERFWHRST